MREESEPMAPADLLRALADAPPAAAAWKALTPIARRDFICWIGSAKQAQTRLRRLGKACSMLAAGKRRPCCYAIVPLDLHKALSAAQEAKVQWRDLNSVERRDFIDWIESAERRETRRLRIEEACGILAGGQRRAP